MMKIGIQKMMVGSLLPNSPSSIGWMVYVNTDAQPASNAMPTSASPPIGQ